MLCFWSDVVESSPQMLEDLEQLYQHTRRTFDYPYHVLQKYHTLQTTCHSTQSSNHSEHRPGLSIRFIQQPLLWHNDRFDIAAYVLLLSLDPLVMYIYERQVIARVVPDEPLGKESRSTNTQSRSTVDNPQDRTYTVADLLQYFEYVYHRIFTSSIAPAH
jgi:hypothetical protein